MTPISFIIPIFIFFTIIIWRFPNPLIRAPLHPLPDRATPVKGVLVELPVVPNVVEDDRLPLPGTHEHAGGKVRLVALVGSGTGSVIRSGKVGRTAGFHVAQVHEYRREPVPSSPLDELHGTGVPLVEVRVEEVVVGGVLLGGAVPEDLVGLVGRQGGAGQRRDALVDRLQDRVPPGPEKVSRARPPLLRPPTPVLVHLHHVAPSHVRAGLAHDVVALLRGREVPRHLQDEGDDAQGHERDVVWEVGNRTPEADADPRPDETTADRQQQQLPRTESGLLGVRWGTVRWETGDIFHDPTVVGVAEIVYFTSHGPEYSGGIVRGVGNGPCRGFPLVAEPPVAVLQAGAEEGGSELVRVEGSEVFSVRCRFCSPRMIAVVAVAVCRNGVCLHPRPPNERVLHVVLRGGSVRGDPSVRFVVG